MVIRTSLPLLLMLLGFGAAACTEASALSPSEQIAIRGTEWSLVELNGTAVSAPGRRPTLVLADSGGRASGFAGCNQFSATYDLTNDTIKITGVAMTYMFCVDAMELERNYLAALESARAYRLTGTRLELLAGEKVVARFEKR